VDGTSQPHAADLNLQCDLVSRMHFVKVVLNVTPVGTLRHHTKLD